MIGAVPASPREHVDPGQDNLFGATTVEPPATVEPVVVSGPPIVVATDGSCLTNPGPGGWCWYADDDRWAAGA